MLLEICRLPVAQKERRAFVRKQASVVHECNIQNCIVTVVQLCPALCDPVDYTLDGILQARALEWAAFPFSRGSSRPRDWTQVSCIASGFFTTWAARETLVV